MSVSIERMAKQLASLYDREITIWDEDELMDSGIDPDDTDEFVSWIANELYEDPEWTLRCLEEALYDHKDYADLEQEVDELKKIIQQLKQIVNDTNRGKSEQSEITDDLYKAKRKCEKMIEKLDSFINDFEYFGESVCDYTKAKHLHSLSDSTVMSLNQADSYISETIKSFNLAKKFTQGK